MNPDNIATLRHLCNESGQTPTSVSGLPFHWFPVFLQLILYIYIYIYNIVAACYVSSIAKHQNKLMLHCHEITHCLYIVY